MSHRHVMRDLVLRHGWKNGAELGVASGQLMWQLLTSCPDLRMIGVDRMCVPERAARLRLLVAQFPRVRICLYETTTHKAADFIADASLDFVFVDADHRYHAVADDIARWTPKVRPGGWMTGHDYNRRAYPGVIKAVDEAFGERVKKLEWNVWAVEL